MVHKARRLVFRVRDLFRLCLGVGRRAKTRVRDVVDAQLSVAVLADGNDNLPLRVVIEVVERVAVAPTEVLVLAICAQLIFVGIGNAALAAAIGTQLLIGDVGIVFCGCRRIDLGVGRIGHDLAHVVHIGAGLREAEVTKVDRTEVVARDDVIGRVLVVTRRLWVAFGVGNLHIHIRLGSRVFARSHIVGLAILDTRVFGGLVHRARDVVAVFVDEVDRRGLLVGDGLIAILKGIDERRGARRSVRIGGLAGQQLEFKELGRKAAFGHDLGCRDAARDVVCAVGVAERDVVALRRILVVRLKAQDVRVGRVANRDGHIVALGCLCGLAADVEELVGGRRGIIVVIQAHGSANRERTVFVVHNLRHNKFN